MGQRKDRKGRPRGPEYRALVTGDRNWNAPEVTQRVLDEYSQRFKGHRMRIIEGGAKGADAAAAQWAKGRKGTEHIQVKAQWDKYGRNAGPMRNRKMLREYNPDAVLGFHDDIKRSKGTKHMIGLVTNEREKYGPREVRIYNSKGERTFQQGADLDPEQLRYIRRRQRREQKARRKNNPAANDKDVRVFKSMPLAELGEISKGAPRYIKDIMAGKVIRTSPDIIPGNGGTLHPTYKRLRRAQKGAAAAKAKAKGDTREFEYNKTMGGVYNHKPFETRQPNLQERLLKYKTDKRYAQWEKERAARTPPRTEQPKAAPAEAPKQPPATPPTKSGISTRRKAALAAGGTGLFGLGAYGATRQ